MAPGAYENCGTKQKGRNHQTVVRPFQNVGASGPPLCGPGHGNLRTGVYGIRPSDAKSQPRQKPSWVYGASPAQSEA
jgi:hypothetical protein